MMTWPRCRHLWSLAHFSLAGRAHLRIAFISQRAAPCSFVNMWSLLIRNAFWLREIINIQSKHGKKEGKSNLKVLELRRSRPPQRKIPQNIFFYLSKSQSVIIKNFSSSINYMRYNLFRSGYPSSERRTLNNALFSFLIMTGNFLSPNFINCLKSPIQQRQTP